MPLTDKGEKILENMKENYGEEKGTSVFYASKNAGKITGVDAMADDDKKKDQEPDEPTKAKVAAGDLPSQLKAAEDELQALEREEAQALEGTERSNTIEDTKTKIRALRDEIKASAQKALRGDAMARVECDEDRETVAKLLNDACDTLAKRLDAYEEQTAA